MTHIFISYKRVDKDVVFAIKERIELALGISCWIDLDGIESDALFVNTIIKAIDECEVFLFMYSKAHTANIDYSTDWTIRELNFAQERKKRIVFVNIDGSELLHWYIFMFPQKQQVNAQLDVEIEKLIKDLSQWLQIKEKKNPVSLLLQEINDPVKINALGDGYYKERKFKEAVMCYEQSAILGSDVAQYNLGYCYFHGRGCTKNYIEAVKWFTKSAEQGNIKAYIKLGNCYENSESGLYDISAAYKWYLHAAKLGNANAQERLASLYFSGIGVNKDYSKAFVWFFEAAKQGVDTAQFYLGLCFEKGYGTEKSLSKAIEWYEKATLQGHVTAQHMLMKLKTIL